MIIKNYSDQYREDVIRLIREFHTESLAEYDGKFSKDGLIKTIEGLQVNQADNCFLLIDNEKAVGILAGVEIKSMWSDERFYQELVWFVDHEYRRLGALFYKSVEYTLRMRGYAAIIMAVMENSKPEKVKRFYGRIGYKHFETHFIKKLKDEHA